MDEAINQFMAISDVSIRETALYYLVLTDQDVEKALNLYYQDKSNSSISVPAESNENLKDKSESSEKKMMILQWNIQGLLPECLKERTVAVVNEIKRLSPDVVMMQEVVIDTYAYIKSVCEQEYKIYSPFDERRASYFTIIMVKSSTFDVKSCEMKMFSQTTQGRNLAIVSGTCCGKDVTVMTSHLESTGPEAATRMKQLIQVWESLRDEDSSHTVIFGGDTNLRDREVVEVSRKNVELASRVEDMWESLGSPRHLSYSWDCSKNDNQLEDSLARLRLGRLYMRSESPSSRDHFRPVSMEFIGMERLPCEMFPSDHWGILVGMTTKRFGAS